MNPLNHSGAYWVANTSKGSREGRGGAGSRPEACEGTVGHSRGRRAAICTMTTVPPGRHVALTWGGRVGKLGRVTSKAKARVAAVLQL